MQGVAAMHSLIQRMAPTGYEQVGLIRSVYQRDRQRRFDLYVEPAELRAVWDEIARHGVASSWYCRPHVAWSERTARARTSGRGRDGNRPQARTLTMMTWNANRIGSKIDYVDLLLQRRRPALVALQETWRMARPGSRALWLGEYTGIERGADARVAGCNGLAILVARSSGLGIMEAPGASSYCLTGRLTGLGPEDSERTIFVMSVYVPCSGDARKAALRDIVAAVERVGWTDDTSPGIVILGDWNMSPDALQKWARKHLRGAEIARVPKEAKTLVRKGKGYSRLDHIVYLNLRRPQAAWVDDEWDASDHLPVVSAWRPQEGLGLPKTNAAPCLRIDPRRVGTAGQAIVNDNRWLPLADLGGLDEAAEAFGAAAWGASEAHGATVDLTAKRVTRVPKPVLQAAKKRRKAFKVVREEPTEINLAGYEAARAECKALLRAERRAKVVAHRAIYGEALRNADPRTAWAWAKRKYAGELRGAASPEVLDPESGSLVREPGQVAQIWAKWFGNLASDTTGHSRDWDFWREKPVQRLEEATGLNDPLLWPEIQAILKRMVSGKACGADGVPAELLKLVQCEADPTSPMGRALWHLVRLCWEQECFPQAWDRAVVVPVPKKGDRRVPDNYRGISLIAVAQKLLSGVISERLMRHVVGPGRLHKAQGGFRAREEAVAQATCLYEILRRRRVKGEATYLCFVDFCKAYDKVPHGALLHKVEAVGARGKFLNLVRALYRAPSLCTRTQRGAAGTGYSATVPLDCGVRQGDPASPVLFNIFINDLVSAEMVAEGVKVGFGSGEKVGILLFADDAVLIAPGEEQLRRQLALLTAWADQWECKVNSAKCGVMVVRGGSDRAQDQEEEAPVPEDEEGPTDTLIVGGPFLVQGEQMPIVRAYTYLGVEITPRLSLEKMAKARSEKAGLFLARATPFLRDPWVPLRAKRMVIAGCLMPMVLYGAEIWGMSEERCAGAQKWVSRAVTMAIGGGSAVPLLVVCDELRILPAHVAAAGRRARLLRKARTLRTYLRDVVEKPFTARTRTWYTGTLTWMKRWDKTTVLEPQALRERMLAKLRAQDDTLGRRYYRDWHFDETSRVWLELQEQMPEWAVGVSLILKMRWRAAWWSPRLAGAGLVEGVHRTKCVACGADDEEDEGHYFVRCSRWSLQREGLRPAMEAMARLAGDKGPETEAETDANKERRMGIWLLGGRRESSMGGTAGNESPNPLRFEGGLGYAKSIAEFVQGTWYRRNGRDQRESMAIVPPRGEAPTGMPVATASALPVEDQT